MTADLPLKAAMEAMVTGAAKQFADREAHAPGCMVSTGCLQVGAASLSIQEGLAGFREEARGLIQRRLEAGRKAGELPARTDTHALAAYFAMVIQGMAVQARDGASPALLKRLAKLAMAAWPEG